ncbi:MAG: family 10 glycosylhydrolase [Clostridia bacterium]|nr:family 10 glycosylhydrolase [Clostridia bacterium]
MKLIVILLCCVLLCSCTVREETKIDTYYEKTYHALRIDGFESYKPQINGGNEMNAIWVSQFDMQPIYRDGNRQRSESDYREKVKTMIENLTRDGFDTVFLQLRPNGDSMYESEYYPMSKYVAGEYGGEILYDAIKIYLEIAKDANISVHAWINPYRLCSEKELKKYGKGTLYKWLSEGIGKRIDKGKDGLLYLDPSYKEATDLIVNGAKEILTKYDFNGIHIDDYFYPTEFEINDKKEFISSGYTDKGDFRRDNVNRTVKALYVATHEFDNKVFGVSPAGNIYSLSNGWYVDIYKWLKSDGYLDYVIPQLYFGFDNATCPFQKVLTDWFDAVENENIKIYIGLSASKCALGSEGVADLYAGEKGKYEWRDNKDILARSLNAINDIGADGVCIFAYSSFYNPVTGEGNILTDEERSAFIKAATTI